MSFCYLKNNKGLTLTELVIGLAVTSILMLVIVSGSLFIQQYINRWTSSNKLLEELSFVQTEMMKCIESSRQIEMFEDSLICKSKAGKKSRYSWTDGVFYIDEKAMLRIGVKLATFSLSRITLQKTESEYILNSEPNGNATGLYKLSVAVSEENEQTDTLTLFMENSHESLKYNQK